ncbi:uncharacterized protein LOC133869139 [Alnus glutinosa]|uniref:uncharacterized protein LOC133869139 n=1 Tax=Alnus glutinosa TaxID=3517 RepID=UPI002D78EC41|nr:uncharacterized protein LOC133869139 [Alnus glutinosa]
MQWFQDIRWSKRVTTWDEFVRILHTRYSVPEKVEEHDDFKNEDEEKEDDAAIQTITPESVQDPIEDTKQIITPEPDPAEATQHKIIPTTNPAQDTNHIQIPEPVQAGNIGQTEIPATSPLIPKPKTSESIVEMSFSDQRVPIVVLSQSSTTDVVDVVLLKHRWRWKEDEDTTRAGRGGWHCCRRSRARQGIGGPRSRAMGQRLGPVAMLFSVGSRSCRETRRVVRVVDEGQFRAVHFTPTQTDRWHPHELFSKMKDSWSPFHFKAEGGFSFFFSLMQSRVKMAYPFASRRLGFYNGLDLVHGTTCMGTSTAYP